MIKIALIGANGRMGLQIAKIILGKPDYYTLEVAVSLDPKNIDEILRQSAKTITDDIHQIAKADVVINFSTPKSSLQTLDICLKYNKPVVFGTTGFNQTEKNAINNAASKIAILLSPNMSLSVNMLFKLTEIAAKKLRNFEAEIVEAHHRYKKDAPSGTAVKLGEVVANARDIDFDKHAKFTRHGVDEERKPDDIGFAVVRGGDIVGKHDVMFIDDGEILTLTSEINNRSSFANGAVIASAFLTTKTPGLYNMFDVLDL